MKKILIVTNHLQHGDGVCRTLICFANALAENPDYDVTINFMLRYDKELLPLLSNKIKTTRLFHIPCFRGYDRLLSFLPDKFLYKRAVKGQKYDLEIAYCWREPTMAISSSTNKEAKHLLYTHGYTIETKKYYVGYDEAIGISSSNIEKMKIDCDNKIPIIRFSNIFSEKSMIEQSELPTEFKRQGDKLLFITIGRLDDSKGFNRVLESAKKLVTEGYDFECWFVGEGVDRNKYTNFIKNNNLDGYVKLLGLQPNPYNLIKQSDILLCASVSEGYSTACVEGCILEVPVISTAVSGADDIVKDSKAGMVVDNSMEGVYEGMKYALENLEEVKKWKNNLKGTKSVFFYENKRDMLYKIVDGLLNK